MTAPARVSIDPKAAALLREIAADQGVTPRAYLEALLHYAGSCYHRPGSWEAAKPFEFATYDTSTEAGQHADRWF